MNWNPKPLNRFRLPASGNNCPDARRAMTREAVSFPSFPGLTRESRRYLLRPHFNFLDSRFRRSDGKGMFFRRSPRPLTTDR